MDIFVHFSPQLNISLDVMEDAIEEYLGDKGEVTGSGIGNRGANVDIEVFGEEDDFTILNGIKKVLQDLGVPQDTVLTVNGQPQGLFENV